MTHHLDEKNFTYERKILFQTDSFEIVSIHWTDQSISELHHHGWSQCLILIEEGLFENTLDLGAKTEIQIFEPGQVVSIPTGAMHEMRCKSPKGRTLHVYTPKIDNGSTPLKFDGTLGGDIKKRIDLSSPTQINTVKNILESLKVQSISTQSPYFMNQLFSGILPQMLIAEDFIAQTKTTLATVEASPALSAIESEVVDSLCDVIGWSSENRSGVSVPGGSAANFMALHCARQRAFEIAKKEGNTGLPPLKVFISEEAHYSFQKACAVLGIGVNNLVSVPVDEKGKMSAQKLEELIEQHKLIGGYPLLVVATAGTTVLGAFDEINPLAAICKKFGVWLHVDGAWGGAALFSKNLRPLVQGIELADSMTFDAHKLFGASLTCSFFLTQHNKILLEANDVAGGDYLFHSDDPKLDLGKLSWQCGRKADAVSFWTIWKSLGTDGLGEFVDRLVKIRSETVKYIKNQSRLELIAEPEYLNICVRVIHPSLENNLDWSKIVRERLKEKNQAMVNYSTNKEGTFLRLILAHPYLNFNHVQQILEWALEIQ